MAHKKLSTLLLVRWVWVSSITKQRIREPPRRTQNQPERGSEVLKREAPAIISVGWIDPIVKTQDLQVAMNINYVSMS